MPSQNLLAVVGSSFLELGPWRLVHWYLAIATLAAALWVLFAGQHRRQWADHELAWWMFHWVTGGRLEGGRSFPSDMPRRQVFARRAAVGAARTSVLVAAALGEYTRSGAPHGTAVGALLVVAAAGTAALAAATLVVVSVACRVAHYRQWVRPLHRAVHKPACWDESKRPWTYIKVRRNRLDGDIGAVRHLLSKVRWLRRLGIGRSGVVVTVAPNFDYSDNHKKTVVNIVVGKLDLGTPVEEDDPAKGGDVTVTWVPHGRHGYVQFRPRAQMPERAMFSEPEVRRMLEESTPSEPVIGLTRGRKPVKVNLDTESPHVLLSAGTGGGKSSTIRTIAAQLMFHGADVTVIDVKRHSHRWARLPGVTYARDLGEIHKVLCELSRLSHDRDRAWDDIDIDEDGPKYTRKVIICEELNATMSVLRQWWKDTREPSDPVTSPAVTALGQVLFKGRAVRIHVLAVAQMATAKDMGGPEMRENYAVRILARYTANAAKMLVPECNLPASTRHQGRAQVCIGGVATETQVIYLSEREARGWVEAKRFPLGLNVASVASRETPALQGEQPATVAAALSPELEAARGLVPVSLLEASSDKGRGIVLLKHDALRKAAERDPEFPAPAGHRGQARLYGPPSLQRWEVNRPGGRPTQPPETTDNTGNEVDEVDRMEAGTRA
jgi:hypothetical protein